MLEPLLAPLSLSLSLLLGSGFGQEAAPTRYIRLVEEGDRLALEVAVRRFEPSSKTGPTLFLAGAMHIGEPQYYSGLQARLDALDLVLFESVKPPGTGDPERDLVELTDEHRAAITEARIRFIAEATYRFRAIHGDWPAELADLEQGLPRDVAVLVGNALLDGWNRPLRLTAAPERTRRPFDVQSLGADGRVGGSGTDGDLCYADQDALEEGDGGGIQKDLADALGLVFQLDAMDHSAAHWRNSDLSIDQIEAGLVGRGADPEELFASLRGTSFFAKAAGLALRLLTRFSYGSAALKILGLEVLGRADEIMAGGLPEADALFSVLIDDRNAVVIEDLRRVLAQEPEHASIGVLYGAAHMRDLEQRLERELGYAEAGEEWLPAVTVDITELGVDPDDVRWMQRTVRSALDRQLGR